jgi:hypothetical protein
MTQRNPVRERVIAWVLVVCCYMFAIPLLSDLWLLIFPPPGRTWDAQAGLASAVGQGLGLLEALLIAVLLQWREGAKPGVMLATGKFLLGCFSTLLAATAIHDIANIVNQILFLLLMGCASPLLALLGILGIAEGFAQNPQSVIQSLAPHLFLFCVTVLASEIVPRRAIATTHPDSIT